MRARIRKWGNSLALRIPKAFAAEANLEPDSLVNVSMENGKIVLKRVQQPKYTLKDLLAGVTKSNLHGEVNTGPAVGNEVW